MKIAFDLDGTLVREAHDFPLESQVVDEHLSNENMRQGVVSLWQQLREADHELWVYTFSYRSVEKIQLLFKKYGLEPDGVVNYPIHDETLQTYEGQFAGRWKCPPMFGFDLLIDNMEEIAEEGKIYNFEVFILKETDQDWVQNVLDKIFLLKNN